MIDGMSEYKSRLADATNQLKSALHAVAREISGYPTPISGCDEQFNHLLAERTRIEAALRTLNAEVFIPTPRTLNPGDPVETR